MKKYLTIAGIAICSLLIFSGCGTMSPENKQLFAMETGGMIGSMTGSFLGDQIGGWGGSMIGSVVGGVAGSAIGAAAVNPENQHPGYPEGNNNRGDSELRFHNSLCIKDILLEDENGNKQVDRNEHFSLVFIIKNEGKTPITKVTPTLLPQKNAKYIKQSSALSVQNIKPGEIIRYQIKLWASPKLKRGKAQYVIRLDTGNGSGDYEESFSIPTNGI